MIQFHPSDIDPRHKLTWSCCSRDLYHIYKEGTHFNLKSWCGKKLRKILLHPEWKTRRNARVCKECLRRLINQPELNQETEEMKA